MLVVSRKENESIRSSPSKASTSSMTLREAFAHGPILVNWFMSALAAYESSIEAPSALKIMRSDAVPRTPCPADAEPAPSLPSGKGL